MKIFITLFYFTIISFFIAIVAFFIQKNDETAVNEENYTVGVVFKAMDSEHWLSVRSGMIEAARKHNMKLIVMSAENEIAYAQQNKIINDLLDNKIDALIVSTTNIFHTDDFMKNAKLKNIPVFMKRI